ncbi:MAG TPA: hypothetical protein VFU90_04655, partial [Candidatus Tumulicola sp.]|nr:hypothetical protein [Candidatus Tumulicola sp.]
MLGKALVCVAAIALAIASAGLSLLPASADGVENVYEQSILPGANTAIKNAMDEANRKREAERRQASAPAGPSTSLLPPGTVGQIPPVSQQRIGPAIGFPTGFGFSADVSSAYPFGDIGSYGKQWLMGGFDGSLSYAFSPTSRVVASMFELQHWPYGFNSGQVPVYLAGFRNPVGCADLSGGNACGPGAGQNLNVATKDTFGVFMYEQLFLIKGMPGGHVLPIVISPTYVARGGQIGESPDNNDVVPFAFNPPDGPVFTSVPTRTAQYKAVAVTLPFLKTPKMFGTFTVAPTWLMHTAGVNSGNSMQLAQVLYLEYTPFANTKIWFEPQSARDYLPTDPYPEHLIAYFLGIS